MSDGVARGAAAKEDERLLALVGCINGLVLEVDEATRYVGIWADDPRLLAAPKEAALGRTILEVHGEHEGAPLAGLVRRVFATGAQEHIEYPLVIGDEERWFWADLKRVTSGDAQTVVVFARDITDRKRAEERLRKAEERYRLISRATKDLLYDFDLASGTTTYGKAAHSFLGTTREVTPEEWMMRMHPEDRARVAAEWERVVATPGQEMWLTRYRLRRDDGTWIDLLDRALLVRDEADKPVRLVGSVADITDLRLLQEQLVQADRLAAIGALAAGVGHEINNPLSYIIGNIEYALDSGPFVAEEGAQKTKEEDVRVALAEAWEGARRIADVVRSLKLFSQKDAAVAQNVTVESVIERSIKMAENQIRHRARLVRDLQPVAQVRVNENQLGQVCLNLLINAAQAITDGRSEANEIKVATSTDGHGRIVVAVTDSGPGIEKEHLGHIFEPFFTTKPNGMGQGIGLSVCLAIVQSMGGELTVTSQPGQTTFRIILPPIADAVVKPVVPATRRPRMLVVDDDVAVGRYIARVMRSECDVTTAVSSGEALRHLEGGETFDVVLCDMMMPEMNGVELYEVLRAEHAHVLPNVFFMTGGAFTPQTAEFLATIPDRALEKPIDKERLRALLRSAA